MRRLLAEIKHPGWHLDILSSIHISLLQHHVTWYVLLLHLTLTSLISICMIMPFRVMSPSVNAHPQQTKSTLLLFSEYLHLKLQLAKSKYMIAMYLVCRSVGTVCRAQIVSIFAQKHSAAKLIKPQRILPCSREQKTFSTFKLL